MTIAIYMVMMCMVAESPTRCVAGSSAIFDSVEPCEERAAILQTKQGRAGRVEFSCMSKTVSTWTPVR